MRTRVRGWRWKRNPLRRRCDVVEAWTALIVAVLLCVGAPLVGTAVGWRAYEQGRATQVAQRAERHQVAAVLAEDAPAAAPATQGGKQPLYPAKVRWSEPGRGALTTIAEVPAGSRSGDRVPVWLDSRDRGVAPPPSDGAVWQHALTAGVWAAGGMAGTVLLARAVTRRVADRHRMAEWEAEWARTGPEWGRRTA